MLADDIKIINLIHPDYNRNASFWTKFRLTYEGGTHFIRAYLRKYSNREDDNEFQVRKQITYCPSFAKMAINEIRNAICQRLPDVSRESGPKSYINAIAGTDGGVNMQGSSMDLFMGDKVLLDLLSIGKIGVFVDMPPMIGPTIADRGSERPYLYTYKAEQIRNWAYDTRQPDKLLAVLLEDANYTYDEKSGLTTGTGVTYRHLWIEEGKVNVQFYDSEGEAKLNKPTILNLEEIPFVISELPDSLLLDVADYQIALMNLESSDLAYILKSNYPFYTEQFDPRSESPYIKQPGINHQLIYENHDTESITYDTVQQIETGTSSGRRYPLGTERPNFIHPSSEPLQISMQKGDQIKRDIRLLVNLAVANLGKNNTGDKTSDPIAAGLSLIGLKIEALERRIGELWTYYEGSKQAPSIHYPQTYSLKTDKERREEATDLETLIAKVPSKTFQRELAKQIATITIGHKIPKDTLEKIKSEIDSSEVVISDPDIIKTDLENGLVSTELASKIRGYPEGQVEQAKIDHQERISRIAIAQSEGAAAARGVGDLGTNPTGGQVEKKVSRDTTGDPVVTDKTRGEAQ